MYTIWESIKRREKKWHVFYKITEMQHNYVYEKKSAYISPFTITYLNVR